MLSEQRKKFKKIIIMTLAALQQSKQIIFESITGSQAYGTNIPSSDTDIKGVFILPKNDFFSLDYTPQISDKRNDIVYYEVGRFVELLAKSNPSMLEMLAMPKFCIQIQHPIYDIFKAEAVLSKQCRFTFAGYAMEQIKKAHGLNKKIVNPMSLERKSILDFCYIVRNHGSISLKKWLKANEYDQNKCGLVKIANMRDLYAVFYDHNDNLGYKGIANKPTSNDVSLSSIPKSEKKVGIFSFNLDGYSTYCKKYKAYTDWVKDRNPARYQNTVEHGKNYDAKNMMHTFRLLDMAYEIATEGQINVHRPNRAFLLRIRSGEFEYQYLLNQAKDRLEEVKEAFEKCDLPERPDRKRLNEMLIGLREEWYRR